MRIGFGVLAMLAAVVAAGQASAQLANGGNVWQNGTTPLPDYGRALPNQQPTTQSQPAGTSSAPAPGYASGAGIAVAGGTFYANGTVGTFYDDNIFATNTNRQHDWAFFQRPELSWATQGQNYTFSTDAFVEGREYAVFNSENQINGGVGVNFTVMPDNDTQIVGGARYLHEHLDRGASQTVVTTPGAPSTLLSTLFTHPVTYDEGIESVALNKRYGNWWSSLGAAGLEINYQNPTIGGFSPIGPSAFGGDTVSLSYADGFIGTSNGRLGYVIRPQTSVFLEVAGNMRNWQVDYFNSSGVRVVAGMLFEAGPGARLKGEFWGGYMNQQYNGVTMQGISSWTYGIGLTGIITDTLSAVIEGRREAKEAALGLAMLTPSELGATAPTCTVDLAVCVSNIESEVGGRLDYNILPKVVISGGVTYLEDDYQGGLAFGRIDRTIGPLAGLKYYATPNVTLGFDFRNVTFLSSGGSAPAGFTTVSALPFYRDIYMFWLNAKLSGVSAPPVFTK
jgi:Putative beta-barrel porin 2